MELLKSQHLNADMALNVLYKMDVLAAFGTNFLSPGFTNPDPI